MGVMMDEISEFKTYLKDKGFRLTPERLSVFEGVLNCKGHFDPDQLYEKVQRYNKKVSRATIYRVIPLLLEYGLITETLRSQGRVSYERVQGAKHHHHMVCLKCGKLVEFTDNIIEKDIKKITETYGFDLVEHRLGITGYCRSCRDKGYGKK